MSIPQGCATMLENLSITAATVTAFVTMLTLTVTRSKIGRPFRDWVDKRTHRGRVLDTNTSMLYELVRCPYCFGFWATLLSMAVFPQAWEALSFYTGAALVRTWVPEPGGGYVVADSAMAMASYRTLSGCAVWCASCLVGGCIVRLFNGGASDR